MVDSSKGKAMPLPRHLRIQLDKLSPRLNLLSMRQRTVRIPRLWWSQIKIVLMESWEWSIKWLQIWEMSTIWEIFQWWRHTVTSASQTTSPTRPWAKNTISSWWSLISNALILNSEPSSGWRPMLTVVVDQILIIRGRSHSTEHSAKLAKASTRKIHITTRFTTITWWSRIVSAMSNRSGPNFIWLKTLEISKTWGKFQHTRFIWDQRRLILVSDNKVKIYRSLLKRTPETIK